MQAVRSYHVAATLPNGNVLLFSGLSDSRRRTADLYDPRRGEWLQAAAPLTYRFLAAAVVLQDGSVLVTGGQDSRALASGERFVQDE
jgi:hypothetical protein